LEKVCDAVHNYDMATKLNFVAKDERESFSYPACGGHSLYNKTNYDGKTNGKFYTGKRFCFDGNIVSI
jgi:hypothetical protein